MSIFEKFYIVLVSWTEGEQYEIDISNPRPIFFTKLLYKDIYNNSIIHRKLPNRFYWLSHLSDFGIWFQSNPTSYT